MTLDTMSIDASTGSITLHNLDNPRAQVIIRTSDEEDFMVNQVVLAHHSTVFQGMLYDLQAPGTLKPAGDTSAFPGIPVIDITEDDETFSVLVSLFYPGSKAVELDTLDVVENVLKAAQKYDMQFVVTRVAGILVEPRILDHYPLPVYAIACKLHLTDAARIAAKRTLELRLADHADDLALIPVSSLVALLVYRDKCCQVADHVTRETIMHSEAWSIGRCVDRLALWSDSSHVPCKHDKVEYFELPSNYIQRVRAALRDRPCSANVPDPVGDVCCLMRVKSNVVNGCAKCWAEWLVGLRDYEYAFKTKLDEKLSEVTIVLDF